ncbi:unnamed protein product [Ceratitis capitata]|uniref:(Mediterranean fruit fly) hypothetical protein n=1 Tax=Ceratitis capitata TaxID=7213 RepID=A0A811VLX2_CERCA|nr:unnamed protein product [Ceratitis capitata]
MRTLFTRKQQPQQDETEANTDLSDLQLNNSIINVIEQHMPIELFMDTPPLTGDCSSTHSTNSMCSSGGISADAELQQHNQQSTTTTSAAVLALDANTAAQALTTDMNDDFPNANVDGDGERPLVFVIITDYDMQQ